MALGPGKYDEALTAALRAVGGRAGLLVVMDGRQGAGFSCQATAVETLGLPALLRHLADAIEADRDALGGHLGPAGRTGGN